MLKEELKIYRQNMEKIPKEQLKKILESAEEEYKNAIFSKKLEETGVPVLHTIPYKEIIKRYEALEKSGKLSIIKEIIHEDKELEKGDK